MKRLTRRERSRISGFTLIEVLIAVLITTVGLLGIAKMQALAISSTKGAGDRSLLALQVGSLVSAMHANKAFWNSTFVPTAVLAQGTTITDATNQLTTPVTDCSTAPCEVADMAALDFQNWVAGMNQQFPTYAAKIDCTNSVPVSCEIYVTFKENTISISKSTAAPTASQTQTQSFSVFVKP